MKLSEYKEKLKTDREYQEAYNKLEYQFLFGNAVLRARLKKGWTQKELASQVGTKQANISRIEGGLGNPTLELIQKVCQALDLEPVFKEHKEEETSQKFVEIQMATNIHVSEDEPMPVPNWPSKLEYGNRISSTTTSTNK
jgi:transcriptional regulator with XRE-family HTH domain